MKFLELPIAEEAFKTDGHALGLDYDLKHFDIEIPDDSKERIQGIAVRPKSGFDAYFYEQRFKKEKIVLHQTCGHLKGDLLSLTSQKRGRVSTPFLIARDGTIYQLFSSAAWSYHLGPGALGGNTAQSRKSIGIEISNYGPLKRVGDDLETIYSKENRKDVYCSISDTSEYVKLETSFRGYEYFAKQTDAQYESLIVLLRYLTAQYNIPREFIAAAYRYTTDTALSKNFEGICSHVNFRTDKVDIGPAFDWEKIIEGVYK